LYAIVAVEDVVFVDRFHLAIFVMFVLGIAELLIASSDNGLQLRDGLSCPQQSARN
jgi:hypothetical protein